MLTMFIHELKQYRKSTIIWNISLVAGAAFYLSLFQGLVKETQAFTKVLQSFPVAVRQAFGITLDTFASFTGFYSYVLTFLMLAFSIQAMQIGASIVSKEERGKTAEFLLTKPIRRSQVLTAKLLAGLTIVLVTNAIFIVGALIIIKTVADATIGSKIFFLLTLTLFLVQLFFLGLGFLVSVVTPKIKSVLSISLTTVFGFYIVGILDSILGAENVKYFTPFKFFDYQYIIKNSSYELQFLVIEAVFLIAAVLAAYYLYLKRDIHTI